MRPNRARNPERIAPGFDLSTRSPAAASADRAANSDRYVADPSGNCVYSTHRRRKPNAPEPHRQLRRSSP